MAQSSSTLTSSPFLTRKQLAERWHVSRQFLEQFKELSFTKIRSNTPALYSLRDVQAYERSHKFDPAKTTFQQAHAPKAA
jgi:hypothetical protein